MYYRVTESTNDMYVTIDAAVASIERQVRKNKTGLKSAMREGALEQEFAPPVKPREEEDGNSR
jgi:putative sigma-54 modulation protein